MIKKNKGITKCDKRTVICAVGIAQCEDETVKCEKKKKGTTICDKSTVKCAQCENGTIKHENL